MVGKRSWDYLVPVLAATGLLVGGVLHVFSLEVWGHQVWFITLALGALPLIWRAGREIFRGKFGVDLIAIVAIFASFWAGEYLAGVVILLMLSGGEALEAYAQARAQRELTTLLNQAPSVAHRKNGDKLTDIGLDEVLVGDRLVIKPGEVVPTDGIVSLGTSNLDESVITGESLPVEKRQGSLVYSGSVNQDGLLEVRVNKPSHDSKYQTIVRLVREAQESQAPVVRLADRYAMAFNLGTFAFALLAWVLYHDPTRVLAVLVVASPCPLILATPIAMISGISRAASRGIVVKNGGALERLGMVRGLVFDKTGTLTLGMPEVVEAVSTSELSVDEVLRLAVSIDQLSVHVFARSLVQRAHRDALKLDYPEKFEEVFGQGVGAEIQGQPYLFGKLKFLAEAGVTVDPEVARSLSRHRRTTGRLRRFR
jgi:cation transport ATPase